MPRNFPLLKSFQFEVVTVDKQGNIIQRETRKVQYFTEDLGNGVTLELVAIRGGTFLIGTEDEEIERLSKKFDPDGLRREKPQHSVTVQPFYLSKFPVTQAIWLASANLPKLERDLKSNPSFFQGDNRPVERVSWYDAVEFCHRLSLKTGREYRLPSEAEWEYAIRAGTTTPFHLGETLKSELANYAGLRTYENESQGEYRRQTTPVGSFPPNGFGLYDMHGNVYEWCADTWHDNYEGAPTDGNAWTVGGNDDDSPVRGGSWLNDPVNCRCASRNHVCRDYIIGNIGFRVLCGHPRSS